MASVLAHLSVLAEDKALTAKPVIFKDLLLAPLDRTVIYKSEIKELTVQEFDLLHFLMVNKGSVMSYGQIYKWVWNKGYEIINERDDSYGRIIKFTIRRLRIKMTGNEAGTGLITNIRGYGYRFNIE
jgi:DNA-binding response OmpR family regulator